MAFSFLSPWSNDSNRILKMPFIQLVYLLDRQAFKSPLFFLLIIFLCLSQWMPPLVMSAPLEKNTVCMKPEQDIAEKAKYVSPDLYLNCMSCSVCPPFPHYLPFIVQ